MIKKTRINLFLASALLSSAILTTAFLPSPFNNPIITTTNFDNSQELQDTTVSKPIVKVPEDISGSVVNKTNITWTNDIFPTTKGYKYLTADDYTTTVANVNASGFVPAGTNPYYTRNSERQNVDGGGYRSFFYSKMTATFTFNGQTYNSSNNTVSALKNIKTTTKEFGNTNIGYFSSSDAVYLSVSQPFLKMQLPLATYRTTEHIWRDRNTCYVVNSGFKATVGGETCFKTVNGNASYAGSRTTGPSKESGHQLQNGGGTAVPFWQHWHSDLTSFYANLTLFNDYNNKGTLLGTHLLNDDTLFTTVMPDKFIVNESLFNKDKNVLEQNFSQTNLFSVADGVAFPSTGGHSLTAIKIPSEGTIEFIYKPNFIFNNGVLVPYTGDSYSVTISGFSKLRTWITPLDSYDDNVVVDRLMKLIINDGLVNVEELGNYLDLSTVPPDVTYDITDVKTGLVSGILSFNITASNGYAAEDYLTNRVTPKYQISLNLTPRITKFVQIADFPKDVISSDFYNMIFKTNARASDPEVNLAEFEKFVKIIAPVENAKYYLVPDSYKVVTGDGSISFKIYPDKYYDSQGAEKAGSKTTTGSHFGVDLALKADASIMRLKPDYPKTERVDKFQSKMNIDANGVVGNLTELAKYIDIQNLPTGAQIKMTDIVLAEYNDQFFRDSVDFNLTATAFNRADGTVLPNTEHFKLSLTEQHLPTNIELKTDYNQTLRVDRVVTQLKTLTGAQLADYLAQFIDLISIPTTATLSTDKVVGNNDTGSLSFDLLYNQMYNASSVLVSGAYKKSFNLTLERKYDPTEVVLKPDYKNDLRIDTFINEVTTLRGRDLLDYLTGNYINAISIYDPSKMTVKIISQDYATGIVKFSINVIAYYDADSDLISKPKNYDFELHLLPKYNPTSITAIDSSSYPKDLKPSEFKAQVESAATSVAGKVFTLSETNIAFLKKFIRFSNIPPATVYKLTWDDTQTDEDTGQLGFKITINQYYTTDGDFIINTSKDYNFNLSLALPAVIPSQTLLTTKADSPWVTSEEAFMEQIYDSQASVIYGELGLFVDGLDTVPTNVEILGITHKGTEEKTATFTIELSGYYDGETTEIVPEVITFDFYVKLNIYIPVYPVFEWWWVALAAGGAAIVGIVIYLIIKRYYNIREIYN